MQARFPTSVLLTREENPTVYFASGSIAPMPISLIESHRSLRMEPTEGQDIFIKLFLEKMSEPNRKFRDLYTSESLNQLIEKLKEVQYRQNIGQLLSVSDKNLLNKFYILKMSGEPGGNLQTITERLALQNERDEEAYLSAELANSDNIRRKLKRCSLVPLIYVSIEEIYGILVYLHLTSGHKGRDRLLKETALQGFVNISREMIETYLSQCCPECKLSQRKKIYPNGSFSRE